MMPRTLLLLLLAACQGQIGGADDSPDGPTIPDLGPVPPRDPSDAPASEPFVLPAPRPSLVRRLSNRELRNALRDLTAWTGSDSLVRDNDDEGFDRIGESQTISQTHVDAFASLAVDLVQHLNRDWLSANIDGCDADTVSEEALRVCAETFIEQMGARAFRRPLADDETERLLALYDAGETFEEGFALVVQGIFRNPHFLYLIEGAEGEGTLRRLTPHALAARLSFGLCETVPDEELRAAAENGTLDEPSEVLAQAQRLLSAPCGRESLLHFFRQWLRIGDATELERDSALFDGFERADAEAMQAESLAFVEHVLWNSEGTLDELFGATYSIVNERTARIYGLSEFNAGEPTELPAERRGILTHPSILAVNSTATESAPIRRGLYVLERLLCDHLPAPPENLVIVPPEVDPNLTTQERWALHSSAAACSGCHERIDPIGFALEKFDAIGRFRETENGRPIADSGGVPTLGIAAGEIAGGAELSEAIAGSDELAHCFARHYLRYAQGRFESTLDEGAVDEMYSVILDGGTMRDALASLVTSASFQSRYVGEEE